MRSILFYILLFTSMVTIHAQQVTIQGVVSEPSGLPLPGVYVTIKGTKLGTQTDFDGRYKITANTGNILQFAYLGFKTKEIKVPLTSQMIHVVLDEDTQQLDEVVVMAQGVRKMKKSLGYAVSTVTSSEISRRKGRRSRSKKRALQGKVSGIHIGNNTVQIRGNSSISAMKEPLYVVDGIAIAKKDLALVQGIDKSKISGVKVYKNKEAKAIYGSKARHGCVVITTHAGNYRVENDEAYQEIKENDFLGVQSSPLSTFSIDVDKASYSNIRRMINNGTTIPADAVKIEEMINYFEYDYPQPKDDHPFAIHTEHGATPWNSETKLVKIGIKGKEIEKQNIPPSNLVFLLDVSGSMSNSNKLPLLKKAFHLLVNQLREKDKVSIVVYAGAAGMVLKPTSGANKNKILNALNDLDAGGSTAGGEGIQLAYKVAKENFIKNGNNRVILATDGDFNVGMSSDKDMKDLIEEQRETGVFLTCLGFGMGNYKDSKLETLADKGNGNHAYIDTLQEAQKVLGTEFGGTLYTIAKDVKIQVEFNPSKVQAYRLIGYENRLLADEDFVDDTKDAGELGSGHTVTALYEIVPTGAKSEYVKQIPELKYTAKNVNQDFGDELLTVKFRYKKPSKKKSIEMVHVLSSKEQEVSTDFKFAASVAWFGMKLRNSKYLKNLKTEDIVALAQDSKGDDSQGYKSEFVRLVNIYDSM